MYEVEYRVWKTKKTKKFDTYKSAHGFLNNVMRQRYCHRAELKVVDCNEDNM